MRDLAALGNILYGSAKGGSASLSSAPTAISVLGGAGIEQADKSAVMSPVYSGKETGPSDSNVLQKGTEPEKAAAPSSDAEKASVLYGEIPNDGVRYGEPDAGSVNELAIEVPQDMVVHDPEELERVKEAMVAAGVGQTLKNALVDLAMPILRSGEPIAISEADAMEQLRAKFGDKTGAKIAAARAMVAEGAKKWPGLIQFLNDTGLGNDPRLIEKLAARAARRPNGLRKRST